MIVTTTKKRDSNSTKDKSKLSYQIQNTSSNYEKNYNDLFMYEIFG